MKIETKEKDISIELQEITDSVFNGLTPSEQGVVIGYREKGYEVFRSDTPKNNNCKQNGVPDFYACKDKEQFFIEVKTIFLHKNQGRMFQRILDGECELTDKIKMEILVESKHGDTVHYKEYIDWFYNCVYYSFELHEKINSLTDDIKTETKFKEMFTGDSYGLNYLDRLNYLEESIADVEKKLLELKNIKNEFKLVNKILIEVMEQKWNIEILQ